MRFAKILPLTVIALLVFTVAVLAGTRNYQSQGEAAAKQPEAKATAGDPITGDWDASIDMQGQTFPFVLKLKLEGDKVTGSSESEQGSAPITKGSWTGEKLSLALDAGGQTLTMNAVIKEGKLVGDLDFAGQFQAKWEAKKK